MDKNHLIRKILEKKEVKDYTYAFFFFLLSSIFAVFAIRPALSIAFSLRREAVDLQRIDDLYENNLNKLVELQTNMEKVQDKKYLLDLALPALPETKTMIDDIKRSASSEGILIKKLNLANVDLKNTSSKKDPGILSISMETNSDYAATNKFVKNLLDQRRIKGIKNMRITSTESVASGSSNLKIILEIEGYYL